jgi:hypothetical protein
MHGTADTVYFDALVQFELWQAFVPECGNAHLMTTRHEPGGKAANMLLETAKMRWIELTEHENTHDTLSPDAA